MRVLWEDETVEGLIEDGWTCEDGTSPIIL